MPGQRPKPQERTQEGTRLRARSLILAGVGIGVLVLLLANAHLVYVAVTSQPDCVPHPTTASETAGSFKAAKPAC
jgi:hypothetical protein